MKKSDKTLKQFPTLNSDQEAEDFVEAADLSESDLSSMKPVKFELSAKDERLTIRLPSTLLLKLKAEAKKYNMPYGRYIRMTLEHSLEG